MARSCGRAWLRADFADGADGAPGVGRDGKSRRATSGASRSSTRTGQSVGIAMQTRTTASNSPGCFSTTSSAGTQLVCRGAEEVL